MRRTIARLCAMALALLCLFSTTFAQNGTVSGTITDPNGAGIPGVTVTVRGTNTATQTDAQGRYTISAPSDAVLVLSSVGYGNTEVRVNGQSTVNSTLTTQGTNLNEVVVIGYGTARRRDVTGSVSSVSAKDFNRGVQVSPDQLIQGKVAGVQVLNNSGQPGGETTVRIRGASSIRTGNQPLFVVDGVPLSGGAARPGVDVPGGAGTTPGANPLNFMNPNDIASIDVLKDASATAIYGSRGANGVVIITTKKGQTGAPRIEVSSSAGFSRILKQLEVLNAAQYREALQKYNVDPANADWKSDVNALEAITRTGFVQNHSVALNGGNENARFRASLGYLDQEGIVRKSELKKYTANLNAAFRFLESRKLGFDLNILTSQTVEQIAPVTVSAGFEGSLIGQALQWNPTRPLRNPDGSLNLNYTATGIFPATNYNPLATSEAYDDNSKTTTVLASITPYFKFTNDLEYRMILSLNYGTGIRRTQIASFTETAELRGLGWAQYGNNELLTRQVTHTLNYNKQLSLFSLNAILGYEYLKFDNKGIGLNARNFTSPSIAYTNYLQGTNTTNRNIYSYSDPTTELQSLFGRVNLNMQDKYLLTATLRADGSSKFGENNRYGYFPSLAFAWNLTNEDFLKGGAFNNLKLRLGWGKTGNQEFPAGSAQEQYAYVGPQQLRLQNVANPDLKWETSTTANVGVDFTVLNHRLSGSVEYFHKNTTDLLFNFQAIAPAPASRYWINLNGNVINSGAEISLNGVLVNKKDLQVNLGVNASFIHNELNNYVGPTVLTGAISGQGLSGAFAQQLANGQPLNSFYIGRFTGLDKDGIAQYEGDPNLNRFFAGSGNPKTLLGINANVAWKKLSLNMSMNGAFGHYIYNNTTQATLAVGNIGNNRNVAVSLYNPSALEAKGNAQPVSTRYLEKGDYLKMANATLSYGIGNISNFIRGANVFVTGQNLFVITKYTGFDPEINTPRSIENVPSFGIEYTPYPTARTFTLGINFSL